MEAWRIEVALRPGLPDPAGATARLALRAAGLEPTGDVRSLRGYLLGAGLQRAQVEGFAASVLADAIADRFEVLAPGEARTPPARRVAILPLPGVSDPVAHSVQKALADNGLPVVPAGTYRVYEVPGVAPAALREAARVLANDVIQQVLVDAYPAGLPGAGAEPDLVPRAVPILTLAPAELERVSRDGGLALSGAEMLAIQTHFRALGREPLRLELETIAQTWSEHCKHKTLTGRIRFEGKVIDNLLKETIAHVTHQLQREFCVSVFQDNAGIVDFDGEDCVAIKVETHNHPSAIEPFGGAGTGVGGVIRDVLGTGLGARPIASTDVFCFAPPDMAAAHVPKGCLHPLQILRGVVAGVRDYGNPMGIPTVNGSIHFDPDFVGNPLVYVGNVGILPRSKAFKQARAGDAIVAIGGRTGRDGIHGATFSSLELHSESETLSGGAVQIGDPITERKAMDAVLRARDEGLFSAITDCGAGGFSSAVGEMADGLGAEVELERAPLKYRGLAPWEIWISEAQERMVLAVPEASLPRLLALCEEETAEACVLGRFTDSGRLVVRHGGVVHGDLDLEFLHRGVPRLERDAVYVAPVVADPATPPDADPGTTLLAVLADPNVASKEWVIRQYDHEVQAASAGKPLTGLRHDGPADAAVLAPKLGSRAGIVLGNGLNPRYSRIDPAAMAECALDEALRNVVATGGDPERTAVLDNYCWGNTGKPERLGELVRASFALRDLALAYHTPFVSGKDSLNNEFAVRETDGTARTIAIPGCILVTALSVIPDVTRTIGSDLAAAGNLLYLVGTTKRELGGSVFWKLHGVLGKSVPRVDARLGKAVLDGVARAIQAKAVVAAHDLSEGGLGAAAAEMAIGGRLGVELDLAKVPGADALANACEVLFSESQSRFLLEVPPDRVVDLEANLHGVPFACVGRVTTEPELAFTRGKTRIARIPLANAARAWKQPLDLDESLLASEETGARTPSLAPRRAIPKQDAGRKLDTPIGNEGYFGDWIDVDDGSPAAQMLTEVLGHRRGIAPKVLILRAPGINCERETFDAFARAGAACEYVHVHQLLAEPATLDRFAILAVPGGFAYGDDIAAGRVLANELRAGLGDRLLRFVDRGGLALGICNGFQALVKLGLLPRTAGGPLLQEATLLHNLSNHYECRWVRLRSQKSRCVFLAPGLELRCPAAHGEGYLLPRDERLAQQLEQDGYSAFVYVDDAGQPTTRYPENPNGSPRGIAGLTDVTGRVLGLMPHPDRAYLPHHLPRWRREGLLGEGDGMQLFAAMVAVARAEG